MKSFFPQFIIKDLPGALTESQCSEALNEQFKAKGHISQIKLDKKNEYQIDLCFSFDSNKDAVISLKEPFKFIVNLGLLSEFIVEPTESFKKFISEVSSSLKAKSSKPKSEKKKEETSRYDPADLVIIKKGSTEPIVIKAVKAPEKKKKEGVPLTI
jgi:hypothetical protein